MDSEPFPLHSLLSYSIRKRGMKTKRNGMNAVKQRLSSNSNRIQPKRGGVLTDTSFCWTKWVSFGGRGWFVFGKVERVERSRVVSKLAKLFPFSFFSNNMRCRTCKRNTPEQRWTYGSSILFLLGNHDWFAYLHPILTPIHLIHSIYLFPYPPN